MHACCVAFLGREFEGDLGEAELHIVVSYPWYSQHQFVVSKGDEEYWQFVFVVFNLDKDHH